MPGGHTDFYSAKTRTGFQPCIGPTCANPDCDAPRLRGRLYCFDCQSEREEQEPEILAPEPPPAVETDCTLYFVGLRGDDSVVKIGRTTGDARRRVNELQVGHHMELCLLATLAMPTQAEGWVHNALRKYRVRGEWFARAEKVNQVIEAAKSGNWDKFFQSFA